MKWLENNQISIDPPKKPKKITGTRFGAILGLNKWNTPFKTWCEITKTYQEEFTDTKFTIAGKTIEPMQCEFMKEMYQMNILTPTDVYGEDYFKKTYGDFFPNNSIFGGMWDYLEVAENKRPISVLEMKTSQRVEDWVDDIPEYYALQAALYAYLLGVDQVYMVASFLKPTDYDNPENFEVNLDNTIVRSFKVSERYPNFKLFIAKAMDWWFDYVTTGISPEYTDKDKDIITILKSNNVNPDTNLQTLLLEAEDLKDKIDAYKKNIADYEKRYKTLTGQIKSMLSAELTDDTDKAIAHGNHYVFTVSRGVKESVDTDRLKNDGIYDRYVSFENTETLRITKEKK